MELMKELYCTSARQIKERPDECDGFFESYQQRNIKTEKYLDEMEKMLMDEQKQ